MTGKVIDLAAARQAREEDDQPHWAGRVLCRGCGHEWDDTGPMSETNGLTCPHCGTDRAALKYDFAPPSGAATSQCADCGNEYLMMYIPPEDSDLHFLCPVCGNAGPFFVTGPQAS